jgi:hypothetical protein
VDVFGGSFDTSDQILQDVFGNNMENKENKKNHVNTLYHTSETT